MASQLSVQAALSTVVNSRSVAKVSRVLLEHCLPPREGSLGLVGLHSRQHLVLLRRLQSHLLKLRTSFIPWAAFKAVGSALREPSLRQQ